jgi:tetratricopeptide (TPR) repeat protein
MGSSGRAAAVLGDRAIARILLNDLDGADADLTQAISADNGFLMAGYMNARKASLERTQAAVARLKAGDIPQAREALNAALHALSANSETKDTSDFALVRLMLKKVQPPAQLATPVGTTPVLTTPISFFPASIPEAQRHFDRAVALVETAQSAEDFAAAIKEFEQACGLVPVWADAYHNLAVMQEALGRLRDALGNYKRYLALAPNASDADKVRARVELLERARMRGPGSSR